MGDFTPLAVVIAAMVIGGIIGVIISRRWSRTSSSNLHSFGSERSVQYFGDRTGSGGVPPEPGEK